jgi:hypothetical protein
MERLIDGSLPLCAAESIRAVLRRSQEPYEVVHDSTLFTALVKEASSLHEASLQSAARKHWKPFLESLLV